ncbi:DUF5666 domain-containing protein [Arthrobacter sp. R-11]|uniref:DUF5666 domain-containing protein n=1 Tax=Arthrobacter sp. R-11 TaxID=3404053 RepID=UPI003CEB2D43
MSTMTPGVRTALIAGGVAVVLGGGSVATVWAANQIIPLYTGASPAGTASPSPGATSPATPSPGNGNSKHFPVMPRVLPGRGIHGEFTVKNNDGSYTTIVTQTGTVQSVSGSNITVKSEDGFTQSYALASTTAIVKIPDSGPGMQGRRPLPQTIKASDLKAGDTVRVSATKNGATVTATRIVTGTWPAGLNGTVPWDMGRQHRHGGNV